jgi:hypothetical protein
MEKNDESRRQASPLRRRLVRVLSPSLGYQGLLIQHQLFLESNASAYSVVILQQSDGLVRCTYSIKMRVWESYDITTIGALPYQPCKGPLFGNAGSGSDHPSQLQPPPKAQKRRRRCMELVVVVYGPPNRTVISASRTHCVLLSASTYYLCVLAALDLISASAN